MSAEENNKTKMSVGRVSRNAAIYGVGTLIRHMTSLIMLPIYTRYLMPADYGAIELLVMALDLVAIFLGLRITQAMFRFYMMEDDYQAKKRVVSTVYISAFILSSIGAGVMQVLAPQMVDNIFGNQEFLSEFRLFMLVLITMSISATGMVFIQARQKPIMYVSFSLFTLLIQVSGNIYFVVYQELHVLGVVYSSLLSGFITSVFLSVYLIYLVGIGFDPKIFTRLVKFVYPLMLASLAGFYVAYADKYFLRVYEGLSAVGLYVLASRIGSVTRMIYSTFNQSWSAARFEVYKQDNRDVIFNQVFKLVSIGLVIIGVGLSIFSKDLIFYMADQSYRQSASIVPLLVAGAIMNYFVTFFNFGLLLHEQTKYLAFASWIRATVATALYVTLIPGFGVYGAALSLLLANSAESFFVYIKARTVYDVKIDFRPLFIVVVISLPVVAMGLIVPVGGLFDTLTRVVLFTALIIVVYRLSIWTVEERNHMRSLLYRIPLVRKMV